VLEIDACLRSDFDEAKRKPGLSIRGHLISN
jgi:hypothetical protein